MMNGKVILIEGLDLAGKSTLVRNLQVELARRHIPVRVSRNALCVDNPIAPIAESVRRVPGAGLIETAALFLAAHLWDARHFEPPPPDTIHLQDSCWLRTLAYHAVRGTPGIPDLLRQAVRSFPSFDVAIFLTAHINERQRRLGERDRERPGSNDRDDEAVLHNPAPFLQHETTLRLLAVEHFDATVVDTTRVPPATLTDIATGMICQTQRPRIGI